MKTSEGNFRSICIALVIPLIAFALGATTSVVRAQETFCIPSHEGLPGHGSLPPTVDGYAGFVTGVPALSGDPIEQGWSNSGLNSYAYGGTQAWMELRGIRHNSQPFVYFSFVVQNDQAFDADDSIVLVLDPGWTSGATGFTTSARRVDIRPVAAGAGAPGAAGTGTALVRHDRPPADVAWRTFQTSAWTGMAAAPSGAEIKVRSWEMGASDKGWSVEVKLPTNAVAGWVNLGSAFGFYANVVKLCGVAGCVSNPVTVQEHFSNQFTWPRTINYTPGATGFRAITGSFLTINDAFDSIPARYLGPATTASTCAGVRFVGGAGGIGVRSSTGTLGTNIDATAGVTNTLVARLRNNGTANDGRGIQAEFRIANWGVASYAGSLPGTWDLIPARPAGNLPAAPLNATMANANPSRRVDVPVTASSDIWMQTQILPSDNYCNPNLGACPAGSRNSHSCIWVLLNSNQNANIWESSVRRNFNITNLSVKRQQAEINAIGWGKGTGPGGEQEFTLSTQRRFLVHPGRVGNINEVRIPKGVVATALMAPNERLRPVELMSELELDLLKMPDKNGAPLWNYIWEVNVSRATPSTLTIGQKTYRVMEPAGTFGTIGQHAGAVEQFVDQLSTSQAVTQVAGADIYHAVVPDGGAIRVDTMLGALAPGESPPAETPKPPRKTSCGSLRNVSLNGPDGGGTMLAGSLLMVGSLGVGGLAFLRRRKSKLEIQKKEHQS